MLQDPSILDFKTVRDINYAIANAFIYSMNIDKSKELMDLLHWSAEKQVNDDLFVKSAPWYKGFTESKTNTDKYETVEPLTSDNPSKEEIDYTKRSKNLVEYVPKHMINPWEASLDFSYKIIDNRVALLSLSWWSMFINTKDGRRMVYYPYTSQIKDSENLNQYPGRDKWFKDTIISQYYSSIGLKTEKIPEISNESYAMDINYIHMKSFLESEGLNFVLWLYNYIKLNKGLVPYNYSDEYLNSIDDQPVYRSGEKINILLQNPLGRSSISRTINQIDGATGISQTGFNRDKHSCGLLVNNIENITDLEFTKDNLKTRINFRFKRPIISKNSQENRVSKNKENIQSMNRVIYEAQEVSDLFQSFGARVIKNYVSSITLDEYSSYGMTNPIFKRNVEIIDEKKIRN